MQVFQTDILDFTFQLETSGKTSVGWLQLMGGSASAKNDAQKSGFSLEMFFWWKKVCERDFLILVLKHWQRRTGGQLRVSCCLWYTLAGAQKWTARHINARLFTFKMPRWEKNDYKVALVMPAGAVMWRLECVCFPPPFYLSLHNRNYAPVHMRH